MELYVKELPPNCVSCKMFVSKTGEPFYCNALLKFMTLPCPVYQNGRDEACPLKELTNAQLAVGWYQEGSSVVVIGDEPNLYLHREDTIKYLTSHRFYKEEPQFTYTDWNGAREASKKGLKITINVQVGLQNRKEELQLFYIDGGGYYLKSKDGTTYSIVDANYDSTEWKVWS